MIKTLPLKNSIKFKRKTDPEKNESKLVSFKANSCLFRLKTCCKAKKMNIQLHFCVYFKVALSYCFRHVLNTNSRGGGSGWDFIMMFNASAEI